MKQIIIKKLKKAIFVLCFLFDSFRAKYGYFVLFLYENMRKNVENLLFLLNNCERGRHIGK